MNVNFEFLSTEPLENLITSIKYKIDKVVYFGYHETIELMKDSTERFLKERCGVQSVVFHAVSHTDLESVLNTLKEQIIYEKSQNSQVYCDLTGGESLILLSFGLLSKEWKFSIHQFDIAEDRLIEFDTGARTSLSRSAEKNDVPMSLDLLVEMRGAKINYRMQKQSKDLSNPEFELDIRRLSTVTRQYTDQWNPFSELVRNVMVRENSGLEVSVPVLKVEESLAASDNRLKNISVLKSILKALEEQGILQDVSCEGEDIRFRFKDERIKSILMEGGSALELVTCLHQLSECDECQVGVHLDWDGVIHSEPGVDVLNEVDVLARKGNIPTFISCKSGTMSANQSLFALYELNTVAKRFGGKYAKKKLVTVNPLRPNYMERAKEMEIEVVTLKLLRPEKAGKT